MLPQSPRGSVHVVTTRQALRSGVHITTPSLICPSPVPSALLLSESHSYGSRSPDTWEATEAPAAGGTAAFSTFMLRVLLFRLELCEKICFYSGLTWMFTESEFLDPNAVIIACTCQRPTWAANKTLWHCGPVTLERALTNLLCGPGRH